MFKSNLYLALFFTQIFRINHAAVPAFAPYLDIVMGKPRMSEILDKVSLKGITLAFVLGSSSGCNPTWGGSYPLNEPRIIEDIKVARDRGVEVNIASGGAIGPYLENACTTPEELADAYIKVLDTIGTDHLDLDIEASVNNEKLAKALAILKKSRPQTTIMFTLMVQGDDYGITPGSLGVGLLKSVKNAGVEIDLVNPMTMEFWTRNSNWGQAIVDAAKSTIKQLRQIWPEKSSEEINRMLGVTPMIGQNFNGKKFTVDAAKLLTNWAIQNKIGSLSFWSLGRDNGNCASGGVSPSCSGVPQKLFEMSEIFLKFQTLRNSSTTTTATSSTPSLNLPKNCTCTTSTTSTTTTTAATVPKLKKCRGVKESRFDFWCESNCAKGNCPPNYCICD